MACPRPNLALRVAETDSAAERRQRVDALLAEALSAPKEKWYCHRLRPTRKITEEEARLPGRRLAR